MQGAMAGVQLQSVSGVAHCSVQRADVAWQRARRRDKASGRAAHLLRCLPPTAAVQEQRAGLQGGKQQQQRPGSGAGGGAGKFLEGGGACLRAGCRACSAGSSSSSVTSGL